MRSVPVAALVELFQRMYKQHWRYEWGHHEEGCVDCSGAFVYAFGQYDIKYPNGSNAIARRYTAGKLLPISEARPGMAAFKAKAPGEKGYALPDKYRKGGAAYTGDLNDYYHIGLVDQDGCHVLNAKGTAYGFCRDNLTGANGWDFVAYLKDVDYGEDGQMPTENGEKAKVILPTGAKGSTVNLRESPSTAADIITKVPVGSEVLVLQDDGPWCQIRYNGRAGWMMGNYVEYMGQADETDALTPDEYDQIDKALTQIQRQIEIIGSIVGRG